jgi:small-conductance mechanosensitive channel/CRP-like cAMP-binding protein
MNDGLLPGALEHASMVSALVLLVALVFFAFLVNRFARHKRRMLRRSVVLFVMFLVASGLAVLFAALGAPAYARTLRTIAELLGVFTGINLAALALFDFGLPAIGIQIATLLADIAIGGTYIVAAMAVMRRFGIDLTGMIAATTIVTSIMALSLQATLGNILGGVALQLDNSIRAGDWIRLENGKEGKVRAIRWRHTVVETRDWDTIVVPNAALLAAQITILGKREDEPVQHRMFVYFNIDFRFSPSDVVQIVEEALQAAPIDGVSMSPPPNVVCLDFASNSRDSFAHYALRYWLTDLPVDDQTSTLVRARLYTALKRANIPLALPAAQLFLEHDDQEKRERKRAREDESRVAALASLAFLNPLTEMERSDIARHFQYAPFSTGEIIMKQGAVAHWLYVLTKGTVEVRVETEKGEKTIASISAPGFFGEMGLMTGEPRTASVVAIEDVDCYRLDKAGFNEILANRPEIAVRVSELVAVRRVELEAAREHFDEPERQSRLDSEKTRLLESIQSFFGLRDKDRHDR